MSDEQALAALGKPSKESEKEGQLSWEYPNLGLTVVINKQRVFYVVQTRGNITDSLSIGDSEKNAVALAKHELEPDVFDREAKVGRAYLSDVDVVVTVKNGEVVKAELMLPGGDN